MQHFEGYLASESMRATHGIRSTECDSASVASTVAAALVCLIVTLPFAAGAKAEESVSIGSEPAAEAQLVVQNTIARVLAAMSRGTQPVSDDEPTKAIAIVDKIVMPNVDLERVSQLVLGKHWRRASLDQRERFKREFGTQLLRTYAIGVIDYLIVSNKLGTQISYLAPIVNESGTIATVPTAVGPSAIQVRIDYRLHRRGEIWKVYDVVVDGVSTVRTYRTSFIAETTRNGIDSLTDQIAAKNREYDPV